MFCQIRRQRCAVLLYRMSHSSTSRSNWSLTWGAPLFKLWDRRGRWAWRNITETRGRIWFYHDQISRDTLSTQLRKCQTASPGYCERSLGSNGWLTRRWGQSFQVRYSKCKCLYVSSGDFSQVSQIHPSLTKPHIPEYTGSGAAGPSLSRRLPHVLMSLSHLTPGDIILISVYSKMYLFVYQFRLVHIFCNCCESV